MKVASSLNDFAVLCMKHGFCKQGKTYSRCIGDGIYQSISIASTEYLNPKSPEYTPMNKKSPCIKIGIWSMYSSLPEFYFSDRRFIGDFYPENFMGASFQENTFMGFNYEYEIMREIGFQTLDSITTQRKLVDITHRLQSIQYGFILPHQLLLCAPLFLCGEQSLVLNHLYGLYAQRWLNFHTKHDHLKEKGQIQEYLRLEGLCQTSMKEISNFLHMIIGKRYTEIQELLVEYLNTNILLAKNNAIPLCDNFCGRYENLDS